MSEQEQARFLDAAGPELALHGYEDAGISPAAPSRAQRRWLGVTNFLARLKNFAYLRLYQERGAELRWIVARRLPGRS
jgi:hypothetical protein